MMYSSWDIECDWQNFWSFWTIFCPFTTQQTNFSPNNPKSQNFEKMKTTPANIIILRKCTINDNHMMYSSWDMKCHRKKFFCQFGPFFDLLPPLTIQKKQNFEKLKKISGDIIILHHFHKNHDHMLYCSLDMACNRFNCCFSFWAIFYPFTSLTAQKIKI